MKVNFLYIDSTNPNKLLRITLVHATTHMYESSEGTWRFKKKNIYKVNRYIELCNPLFRSYELVIHNLEFDDPFSQVAIRSLELDNPRSSLGLHIRSRPSNCWIFK